MIYIVLVTYPYRFLHFKSCSSAIAKNNTGKQQKITNKASEFSFSFIINKTKQNANNVQIFQRATKFPHGLLVIHGPSIGDLCFRVLYSLYL